MKESTEILPIWFEEYRKKTVFDRAIPNIMDGQKSVQRKVLYTALKVLKNNKWMNTGAFSGTLKAEANYHHGDLSRDAAIVNMTADFKNQLPMFIGEGNFGNRFENAAAATRYTQIKFNPEFQKYIIMNEILKYSVQDDNEIYEPDFYFFSIPIVLINGISGIAVGLKTDILGYNISDIKKNIKLYLNNKTMKEMIPYFPEFKGTFKKEENKWFQYGIIEKTSSTTFQITEIPTVFDRTKYISILQKLKEKNIIIDYENNSAGSYNIQIKVSKKQMEYIEEKGIYDIFRLKDSLTENIKVLSPEGNKVIEFESPNELIKCYVDYMLQYIIKYINFKKHEYSQKIDKLNYKIKFIEYILSIDIRKYTMKQIKENIIKFGVIPEEFISEFMGISISGFTLEAIEKYKNEINENTILFDKFSKITAIDYYKEILAI